MKIETIVGKLHNDERFFLRKYCEKGCIQSPGKSIYAIPPVLIIPASLSERGGQISQAIFLKTWGILGSGGYATTEPPEGIRKTRDIWSGKIKMCDLQDHLLVRNVELDDHGRLCIATVLLAF